MIDTPSLEIPNPSRSLPDGLAPERKGLRLRDGVETSVYVHPPADGVPLDCLPVLYLHGIQSHPGWFSGSARALADAGHAVYQVTRRGSGDAPTHRGDAVNARQLLDDVAEAVRFVLADAGADRLHLVAVSWGGKLVAGAFGKNADAMGGVASVTLVAPGLAAKVRPPVWVQLAIVGLLISPVLLALLWVVLLDLAGVRTAWLFPVGAVPLLLMGPVLMRLPLPIPLSDPALFTDTERFRQYLRDDPFRLVKASARFLLSSRVLDGTIKRLRQRVIPCPTTLILSGKDRIINNDRTRRIAKRLAGDGLEVVELSGEHTMEFEEDPTELFRTIVQAVQRGE